jgi:hypothetical protein
MFVMMVEHSPHHHNDEGSSTANTLALGGIKWQKWLIALANNSGSVVDHSLYHHKVDYSSPANTGGRKWQKFFKYLGNLLP